MAFKRAIKLVLEMEDGQDQYVLCQMLILAAERVAEKDKEFHAWVPEQKGS